MKKFILGFVAVFLFSTMPASADVSHIGINVKKLSTLPVVDGSVSVQEWGEPVASITPSSENYLKYLEEANGQNTDSVIPSKVELFVGWSSQNLYVGLKVTDSTHYNPYEGADAWIGDSFECDIGVKESEQRIRFRNNISLGKNNTVYGIIHNKPNDTLTDMVSSGENMPGTQKVTRSGSVTTYELELPWSTYSASGSVKAGYKFYLNTQLHISDGVLKGNGVGYEDYLGMIRYGTAYDLGNTLYPLLTLQGDGTEETDDVNVTTGATTDNEQDDPDAGTTADYDSDDQNSAEDNDKADNDGSPDTGSSAPGIALSLAAFISLAVLVECRRKKR